MTAKGTGSKRPPRLPDVHDAGDTLDHFVSGFEWTIPTRVQILDFDFLERTPGELDAQRALAWSTAPPLARAHVGPRLLENFLKLQAASDDAILAYAKRWGPLWLCSLHNLPWRHDPSCVAPSSDFEPEDEDDVDDASEGEVDGAILESHTWYDEPLSAWRDLSAQARATVRLARHLHDGQTGFAQEWDALPFLPELLLKALAPTPGDPFASLKDYPTWRELESFDVGNQAGSVDSGERLPDVSAPVESDHQRYTRLVLATGRSRLSNSKEFQRHMLAAVLNYWLDVAHVRPRLDWSIEKPVVQLGGDGLFGAIAVQLLFDCSRTDGLAVCTSCGTPFLPGPRRPRRDRNAYCSDCGIKAAARDAAARYRQTKKYQSTYRKWLEERKGTQNT